MSRKASTKRTPSSPGRTRAPSAGVAAGKIGPGAAAAPTVMPPARTPGLVSFAVVLFAVSLLISLALDWGMVSEAPNLVGGLIGVAFPAVIAALAVAAVSFRDPKGTRGLLWRAGPPAVVFGLARAAQFAAGLSPMGPDGESSRPLAIAGGVGVFLVGAGLLVLGTYGARRVLVAIDRRHGAEDPAHPRPILAYPAFAATMVVASLLITEWLVGSGLPPPHLFHLASYAALPLGFALLAGIFGFRNAGPERHLGRRIAPALAAFSAVWLLRGVAEVLGAGGSAWQAIIAAFAGLASGLIIITLASAALYAVQGVIRMVAARRAAAV